MAKIEKSSENLNGKKLRDKITGFEGVAIARCDWLYGCVRYTLQSTALKKDGGTHDTESFDEQQLELVEETIKHEPVARGGSRDDPQDRIDPVR